MGFISLVVLVCLSLVNPGNTNSWNAYIDMVIDPTSGDTACIIGLDNGESWTTSKHPNAIVLKGSEGADIAETLRNKDFTAFMSSGIQVGGVRYHYLSGNVKEDGTVLVLGELKRNGEIAMQSSNTAIVIAHTKEGGAQENTNVEELADYLKSVNM